METGRIGAGKGSLAAFFVLTFGFSWAIWLPKALAACGLSTGLEGLPEVGAFGPTVAAVVLVYLYGGSRGVKRLFGRLFDAAFGKRWYLAALLLFPAITLLALAAAMTVGETPAFPWTGQRSSSRSRSSTSYFWEDRSRRSSAGGTTRSSPPGSGSAHWVPEPFSGCSGGSGTCRGSTCPR